MKAVRWLVVLAGVGGLAGFAAWRMANRRGAGASAGGAAPAAVSVARVGRRTAVEKVTLTGVVRPRREAEVVAKVQGKVARCWSRWASR